MAYFRSKRGRTPILQQDFPVVLEKTPWERFVKRFRKRRVELPAYSTAPDPQEPKWKQARRDNHEKSPILRLPHELLVVVFAHLDPLTLFALRQTCSNFHHAMNCSQVRQMVSGPHPRSKYRKDYFVFVHPDGWRFYDTTIFGRVSVVDRLRQFDEQLCSRCRLSYEDGTIRSFSTDISKKEFLWCRGCGEFHDFFLFSDRQRRRSPVEWTCIGREGALPLCQHKSISWDDVSSLAAQQAEGTTMTSALACGDPEHTIGEQTRTRCKVSAGELLGSFNLDVVWILAAFDLDPAVPVTREHIRRFMDAQTTTAFGAAFCPHVKPNDGRLLLPFAPSVCVCFDDRVDDGGDAAAAATEPMHTHENGRPCCRCAAKRCCPGRKQKPVAFLSAEDGGCNEQTWDQDTRHAFTCSRCEACYTWVREWESSRVYLRCHRRLLCQTSPASKRWLKHIHPASWRASADRDRQRKRLIVCETPRCQTQARWAALVAGANWAPTYNWQWAALPMQLPALRDTRLCEEAALEGVLWSEWAMTSCDMRERVSVDEIYRFLGSLMLAAARQPSQRMLAAVRQLKAAFTMCHWMLPRYPDQSRREYDEAPASWAAKAKQQAVSVANLVDMYRVYPDVASRRPGSLERRLTTAFQLLQLNSGEKVAVLLNLGLPLKKLSTPLYKIYRCEMDEWRNSPAATPEIEQARRVVMDRVRSGRILYDKATLGALMETFGPAGRNRRLSLLPV